MAVIQDADGQLREVRWSARRKADVARRVDSGEPVELVAAEVGLKVADLVLLHARYVAGGTTALKGYHPHRHRRGNRL
jgi:hypothetical protein